MWIVHIKIICANPPIQEPENKTINLMGTYIWGQN